VWLPGEDPAQAPADIIGFDGLLADDDTPPAARARRAMPLQIIYTSGTESLPKGAMLTHEAVMWEYVSCVVEGEIASENDLLLHALPLYHCAQLDVFLGPAVYVGATSVITGKPVADNILALLARHRVNSFFAPPSIWIALLRSPQFDAADLSALAQGLLRRVDHAGRGAAGDARRLPARCGCGTSTARPRSRHWRPCSSRRTNCARRARQAARY
jgi:fatty-acyl-CoA synthase